MPTLKPGQTLGGYEIISFHGKGGMGEIFRARQLSIGREVALKILSPELARRDPQFAKSFVDEARAAGRLNHPNIIAVHDVGHIKATDREEYLHYFSMEFVDGENLRQVIDREGTCPMPLVESTMLGMAEALVYAESMSMIHRDIKPENIMLTKDGRIKLADFGLAQEIDPEGTTADRDDKGRVRVMGTPRYMSPEQARGRSLDGRSDQYSLGATLFHLLTGAPPYRRENGRATMKAHVSDPIPDPGELVRVTPAWRSLCMRLMAKDPEERFATAEELKVAVQQAIAGRSTVRGPSMRTRRSEGSGDLQATSSSSRALFAVAGGVIIIAAAALYFSMGSKADPILNPVDPIANAGGSSAVEGNTPGSNDANLQLRRAQDIIDRLPTNAAEAIAEITTALGNPYFADAGEARQLLNGQLAQLRSESVLREREENRRRLELQGLLVSARSHAQDGKIGTALSTLSEMSAEDRQLMGEDFNRARQSVMQQARSHESALQERINQASNETELASILQQAATDGLPGNFINRLEQARDARLEHLRQATEAAKAEALAAAARRTTSMLQSLNELRSPNGDQSPDIRRFVSLANDYVRRFDEPELKELFNHLAQIGQMAQETTNRFDAYLRSQRPIITVSAMGGSNQARLESIDGNGVWLEMVRGGVRLKKPLADTEINHRKLITQAAQHFELSANHLASYLWMWQLLAGAQLNGQQIIFDDADLTAASARVGGDHAGLLANHGKSGGTGNAQHQDAPIYLQRAVVFAQAGDAAREWFSGTNVQVGASGLVWRCEDSLRLIDLSEDRVPTMQLKHPISPPFTAEIDLQVEPGSLIMVGVRQESRAVRLGLDSRNNRIGGIITGDSGQIRSSPLPNPDSRVRGPLKITIAVDEQFKVSFTINGQAYQAPADQFRLPGNQPLHLVFQALNTNNTSAVSLQQLRITTEH